MIKGAVLSTAPFFRSGVNYPKENRPDHGSGGSNVFVTLLGSDRRVRSVMHWPFAGKLQHAAHQIIHIV